MLRPCLLKRYTSSFRSRFEQRFRSAEVIGRVQQRADTAHTKCVADQAGEDDGA